MGVVDTSGSMCGDAIHRAVSEFMGLCEQAQAPAWLGSCDAQVHAMEKVENISDVAKVIKGGGGTDFRPGFEAIRQMDPEDRPDLLALFTDGDGPAPEVNPFPDMVVLFVLVESSWGSKVPYDSNGKEITWGDKIHVPRKKTP